MKVMGTGTTQPEVKAKPIMHSSTHVIYQARCGCTQWTGSYEESNVASWIATHRTLCGRGITATVLVTCACEQWYRTSDAAQAHVWADDHRASCPLEPCPHCGQAIYVKDGDTQCGGDGEGACCAFTDEPGVECDCESHDPEIIALTYAAHSKHWEDLA